MKQKQPMNKKQYEAIKQLACNWQNYARQAYIDGNMVRQALCHQAVASYMEFLALLENEETETIAYTRFGAQNEQMIPIGPHQTVQKVFHDRYLEKTKANRTHANDLKELQKGDEGL